MSLARRANLYSFPTIYTVDKEYTVFREVKLICRFPF